MSASGDMRITVTENGPYRVTGSVPLVGRTIVTDDEGFSVEWGEGETFTTESAYELCRCGGSETSPFCDRACDDNGFDGTETASREPYLTQAEEQVGPNLILTDAENLCSFARFCDLGGQIRIRRRPPACVSYASRGQRSTSRPESEFVMFPLGSMSAVPLPLRYQIPRSPVSGFGKKTP